MKKKIYLALATLLCVASVGGQTLTANAAPLRGGNVIPQGNKVIITNMGNCNVTSLLESILQQLPNCKPSKPECPDIQLPETQEPAPETPDTENPDTQIPEEENYHRYVQQIVDLVNIERNKAGLASLTLDKKATAAAQVRAEEIRHSFSHTRPNGSNFSTALREQNVSYRRAGENIAWGQPSPEAVVKAWMNSNGHRANILSKSFSKIGVGYIQYNGRNYWSQLFVG